MNKKVPAGLVSVLLLGAAAMWLHMPRKEEPVTVPDVADQVPPVQTPPPPEPVPVASLAAQEEARPMMAQARTREETFPTSPGAGAGFYNKHMTVDFEIYLQFMGIGAYSEMVNGRMASEQLVQNIKAQLELTDEELDQLVEAGRSALQSDRAFQYAGIEAVCRKGDSFGTVEELGAALDELNKRIEANQEELGRKAMQQLEPVLASRIRNRILNAPRQQVMTGDLAVVMARRNHGLETELERVCNSGK